MNGESGETVCEMAVAEFKIIFSLQNIKNSLSHGSSDLEGIRPGYISIQTTPSLIFRVAQSRWTVPQPFQLM